jgi:predicted  nucleic acid-binding Zn-ribbon protein
MRTSLDAVRLIIEKERAQLNETERFRRDQERELKAQSEMLTAAKNKAAKNTKEFNAVTKELDAQRKTQTEREEEILKLLTAIEEFSKSIASHEAEYKKLFDEIVAREKLENEKMAEFDKRLDTMRQTRKTLEGKVPASLLNRYNQIQKRRRDGVAIVGAQKGSCLGCHMNLPPQLFNIVIKSTTIETCPGCYRILFFQPPEENPEAHKQA